MDELRDAVAAAFESESESVESTPDTATSTPSTSTSEPVVETKNEVSVETQPKIEEKAPTSTSTPVPPTPTQVTEPTGRVDRAPATWKGEAKAVWNAIPLHVRQEITKRERDMNRAMQEHAQVKQSMEVVNNTIAPYADIIQRSYGGSPAKAVQQLLEVERILTTAPTAQKAQFVANLIKHYGIDIQALDGFLAGQASPEHQQQLNFQQMLDQRLAPLVNYVQQQQQVQQQRAQQVDQEALMTVDQMANDAVNYPYFYDVKDDMADLIDVSAKKGVYLSLQEAYTKAIRMNDLTYDATTAQVVQAQAQKAQQQALAAKAASMSISGSPISQPAVPSNPNDLHALLSSNYDNMMNGGRV